MRDLYFDVGGLRFFAKRYGKVGGLPVIALHGWMDNCASFERLAPSLSGCDIVCIDCAGHGKSAHRPHLGAYNIWQDVAEVFCIADQLGWNTFALLGHSRGGICSFLAAGTLPERISHLVLVEGVYPPLGLANSAPQDLAVSIKALLASQNRPKRYYDTFEQSVIARANGLVSVSMEDARILALHGTEKSEQGYSWCYDYKLSVGSELRLSFEQVQAFQSLISVKTLVILGDEGLFVDHAKFEEALSTFHQAHVVNLPGGHHLHMSTQSKLVAQHILTYLFD